MENNKGISVIVPCYNDQATLKLCLDAIVANQYPDCEIIVVDDNSKDSSLAIARSYDAQVISSGENLGAGWARTHGASFASKDILLFIDADIIIPGDFLRRISQKFSGGTSDVIMGVMDKEPCNRGFMASLLALEANFYHSCKDTAIDEVHTFSFAIRRSVFSASGGFSSTFRGAGGEEYEFGYKLTNKGCVLKVDPKLKVGHYFDSFFKRTVKLFRRSVNWFYVFAKQRRFGVKGTSLRVGLGKVFGSLFLITLAMSALKPQPFIYISLIVFIIELLLLSNFFYFIYKEKGTWFLLRAVFILQFWSLVVVVGVIVGFLQILFKSRKL
ncbi:MAG: glycosyltransferase [Candidatus Omnitrophica bacterium]|nr:glycosyltransferase [Candidatus Omnitrophota bacterium]